MSIINNQPPKFSENEIKEILKNNYGLFVKVKLLVSDIGQNFLVSTQDQQKFIFKIANPSEKYPVLEAHNQVMKLLHNVKSDFRFPSAVSDLNNQNIIKI